MSFSPNASNFKKYQFRNKIVNQKIPSSFGHEVALSTYPSYKSLDIVNRGCYPFFVFRILYFPILVFSSDCTAIRWLISSGKCRGRQNGEI